MSESFFITGGPLESGSPAYIRRDADEKAAMYLRRMEYIALIESRQDGKTSLINQLIGHFSPQGYSFAVRDLSAARAYAHSEVDWYTALGQWLLPQLSFIPREHHPSLPTNTASWELFLINIAELAQAADQYVVVILDEIGAMPSIWATDFFAVMRSVYTSRQTILFWRRLTFIIAGAFNPKELIQDDTISNFNVDQRVFLADFNLRLLHHTHL